jgi:hypothetical protein
MSDIFIRKWRDTWVAQIGKKKRIFNAEDMEAIESECAFI